MNFRKGKCLVALLGAIALLALLGGRAWNSRFTPERWAEAGADRRSAMVDSLLKEYGGLVGLTREEATALLGEDAPGEQREERLLPGGDSRIRPILVYPLAFPDYLYLYLEEGRVVQAEVSSD